MRILNKQDVQKLFSMQDAFEAVREASIRHITGEDTVPPRVHLKSDALPFESLVMPGLIEGRFFGLKVWYELAAARGELPRSSAFLQIMDLVDGSQALLEASTITDFRTGAMTGLVAERVFRAESPQQLGIIGTGVQARTQILAVLHAFPALRTVLVFARNAQKLSSFVADMTAEISAIAGLGDVELIAAESAEEACRGSRIVIAATSSSEPVIFKDWIDTDHALVVSIGSHAPADRELDPEIVVEADAIIVDTVLGSVDNAGDIGPLLAEGRVSRNRIQTIGEAMLSEQEFKGLTILKTVGFAAADLYSAKRVLLKNKLAQLGYEVDFY
ncbi:MAG: ornithine cyclodeaminase family protein [Microbacteriaceae bacterium]